MKTAVLPAGECRGLYRSAGGPLCEFELTLSIRYGKLRDEILPALQLSSEYKQTQ